MSENENRLVLGRDVPVLPGRRQTASGDSPAGVQATSPTFLYHRRRGAWQARDYVRDLTGPQRPGNRLSAPLWAIPVSSQAP